MKDNSHQNSGKNTRSDILSQAEACRKILVEVTGQYPTARILHFQEKIRGATIFTGCGITGAMCRTAANYCQHLGIESFAYPSFEIVAYPQLIPSFSQSLVAASRSGMTTETIWAVDKYRQGEEVYAA